MSGPRQGVGVRVFLDGDAAVNTGFAGMAASGKRFWASVAGGAVQGNAGLRVLSAGVGELKGGVKNLTGQLAFGTSTLSAFGPAGIGVAAVLGAVAIAAHKTRDAIDFSDTLDDLSQRLKVNTDFLQEFHHALQVSGVAISAGDDAIQGLNGALGKLQNNVSRGPLKKFGEQLFSKEELASYHDASDILPVLASRMQKFGTSSQVAIAQAFKVEALLPVLKSGEGGLTNLMEAARALGIVVDASLIKNAAEASDKLKIVGEVINKELISAFADAAPAIVTVAEAFAQGVKESAAFGRSLADAVAYIDQLNKPLDDLQAKLAAIAGISPKAVANVRQSLVKAADPLGLAVDVLSFARRKQLYDQGMKNPVGLRPGDKVQFSADWLKEFRGDGGGIVGDLGTKKAGKKAPEDQSDQVLAKAKADLASAVQAELQSRLESVNASIDEAKNTLDAAVAGEDIATLIDQRAGIQQQLLAAETQAKVDAIDAQEAEIRKKASKHLISQAAADEAVAALESAKSLQQEVQAGKAILIAKQQIQDKLEAELADRQKILDLHAAETSAMDRVFSAETALATTQTERRAIALRRLAADQKQERDALELERDKALVNNPGLASYYENQLRLMTQAQGLDRIQALHDTLGPLDQYLDDLNMSAAKLSETIQGMAVSSFKSLADGIADAAVNGKNLGDVLKNVLRQLVAQALSMSLQKAGGGLLGTLFHVGVAAVSHGASGGGSVTADNMFAGASGLRMDGLASGGRAEDDMEGVYNPPGYAFRAAEHDTELALIGRSGQVFNHDDTARFLRDIANGGRGGAGRGDLHIGGSTVIIHAEGAGPREVDVLTRRMDQFERDEHGRIVSAVIDAGSRGYLRGG